MDDVMAQEMMAMCGWDQDTMMMAEQAFGDWMEEMMDMHYSMEDFNYMDYIPDYNSTADHFSDNGIELTEDCYNWLTSVDLMMMDDTMQVDMMNACGWDNQTM